MNAYSVLRDVHTSLQLESSTAWDSVVLGSIVSASVMIPPVLLEVGVF